MNASFLSSHIPTIAAVVPRAHLAGPRARAKVTLPATDERALALFPSPPPSLPLGPALEQPSVPKDFTSSERAVVEGFDPGSSTCALFGQTARTSAQGTLFLEDPKVPEWQSDLEDDCCYDDEGWRVSESHEFRGMPGQRTFSNDLRQDWKARMGAKPDAYFRTLFDTPRVALGGGRIELTRGDGALEELEVCMDLRDPESGQAIGQMDRQFSFPPGRPPEVYHSYFGLDPEAQGKGIAKDLLANSIKVYEQIGISKIGVFAALEVGGYAWAKYGFRPKPGATTEDLYDTVRDRVGELDLPTRTKSMVRRLMADNNPRAVWALSDLEVPVAGEDGSQVPLGKALLMGTCWRGSLDLDDPASRARFDQYIQRS